MDLKDFKTDEKLEIEGVWEEIGKGVEVKVARIRNPEFQKEMARLLKPYKRMVRRGGLSEDLSTKLLIKTMAKTVLLGWKGLKEDGVDVPYNYDNAVMVLSDYPDFRDLIVDIANDMDTFKSQMDGGSEENS